MKNLVVLIFALASCVTLGLYGQEPLTNEQARQLSLDQMPSFQGGGAGEFSQWVMRNLRYPADETVKSEGGRVTVSFAVLEDGSVADIEVIQSLSPIFDKVAVDTISDSPLWEPGKKDGKPIKVKFTLPVIFSNR